MMTKRILGNISRRDFLGGVALTSAAGAMMSPMELFAQQSSSNHYYPPSLTGMRGSHVGSYEVAHSVSWQGKNWAKPKDQTDDIYDMIVVGGGISGLSAAYFYQQKLGGGARILILDNHDDFGGHAKRNEFDVDGKKIITYGGSETIEGPSSYSAQAKQLLKEISIETDRFYSYFHTDFYKKWELGTGIYFDGSQYGKDTFVKDPFSRYEGLLEGTNDGPSKPERIERVRSFPVSKKSQDAIISMLIEPKDHFPDLVDQDKIDKLRNISYMDYLQQYYDMPKEATDILRDDRKGSWGVGWDDLSAFTAAGSYMPGMDGYNELVDSMAGDYVEEPYIFHFPDGNAGVARALVRKLVPGSVPGTTMEDLVTSRVNYGLLDQAGSDIRIRLNSTAVDVRHTPDQSQVDVTYVRNNEVFRVRAKHVVMACYNNIIPYICPEVPEKQREAIASVTKIPLVSTSIALTNWRALAERGVWSVLVPKSELQNEYYLDFPTSMGDYKYSQNPDQPIVLRAWYIPTAPDQGYNAIEQAKLGRMHLYQLAFSDFENTIVKHLDGMFGDVGFDVERDIAGITVNRWPHGYAYEYSSMSDPADYGREKGPHIAGRAQMGRISIANSDAEAYAYVDGAIDAAYRAVGEQLKV